MSARRCPECGARLAGDDDSCATRFETLLALDHSRRQPWGSRHGQAFAAFALQHPSQYPRSLDAAWTVLYRIYCHNESPAAVFGEMRETRKATSIDSRIPARPPKPIALPEFTIVDLDDFAAASYPARLDEWCRATLRACGVNTAVEPRRIPPP